MEQTIVTLPMGKVDVAASTISVLEHLAIHSPEEQDLDYNTGLSILFDVLRTAVGIQK